MHRREMQRCNRAGDRDRIPQHWERGRKRLQSHTYFGLQLNRERKKRRPSGTCIPSRKKMQDAQDTGYWTVRVHLAALIRESLEGGKDVSQVKLPLRSAIIPASWCAQNLPATSQPDSQDAAARLSAPPHCQRVSWCLCTTCCDTCGTPAWDCTVTIMSLMRITLYR